MSLGGRVLCGGNVSRVEGSLGWTGSLGWKGL